MTGNRYFTIPFDLRNDPNMVILRKRQGGMQALGRWVSLLAILFDQDGRVSASDPDERDMLMHELDIDGDGLDAFIADCIKVGYLDADIYGYDGSLVNHGVCDDLEYRRAKAESGRSGGATSKRTSKTISKRISKPISNA